MTYLRAWLAAVATALLLTGCGRDEPAIEVAPAAYDFGRVLHGTTHSHRFRITNHSARTVSLQARANCGCFAVGSDLPPALGPGESAALSVLYSSGAVPVGPVRGKFVTLTTDHPDAPEIVVPLRAESYVAFEVIPKYLDLGRVDGRPENYAPRRVAIRPMRGYQVAVAGLFAMPSDTFDVTEGREAEDAWVEIRLRPDAWRPPDRPFHGQIKFDLKVTDPDGTVTVHRDPYVTVQARFALPVEPVKR